MQCPYCHYIYKVPLEKLQDSFIDICPRCDKKYKSIRVERNIFKGEKIDDQNKIC